MVVCLFVMGSCVVCAWCCCYVCVGVNGAFQINPVCVVCEVTSD